MHDYFLLSVAENDIYGFQSEIALRRVAESMIFSLDAVERCSSSVTQNFRATSYLSRCVNSPLLQLQPADHIPSIEKKRKLHTGVMKFVAQRINI